MWVEGRQRVDRPISQQVVNTFPSPTPLQTDFWNVCRSIKWLHTLLPLNSSLSLPETPAGLKATFEAQWLSDALTRCYGYTYSFLTLGHICVSPNICKFRVITILMVLRALPINLKISRIPCYGRYFRKLRNEELHNYYSLPNVTVLIKTMRNGSNGTH
jgi:hypothetical protein